MSDQPITEPGAPAFDASDSFELTLWTPLLRAAGAALWLLSRVAAPLALVWVVAVFDPPAGPLLPVLAFLAAALCLLAAERLLRKAAVGLGRVRGDALRVEVAGRTLEAPAASLAALRPWRLPLPVPGLTLRRAGGGPALRVGLEDPGALLAALAAAGSAPAAAARADAAVAHARARARWRGARRVRSDALRLCFRWVVFALIPTCAFFYTHQSIAFGGPWGEYRLYGSWWPWLRTFLRFWLACVVFVSIYAAMCRGLASFACLAATHVAPSQAARARRVAEWGDALLYYAGVPALTALRYLP
jgi:hypothetical protein